MSIFRSVQETEAQGNYSGLWAGPDMNFRMADARACVVDMEVPPLLGHLPPKTPGTHVSGWVCHQLESVDSLSGPHPSLEELRMSSKSRKPWPPSSLIRSPLAWGPAVMVTQLGSHCLRPSLKAEETWLVVLVLVCPGAWSPGSFSFLLFQYQRCS